MPRSSCLVLGTRRTRAAHALAGLGKEEEAAKAFEAAAACCEAAGERDGYREMAAAQRAASRRSARPRRRGSRRSRPTCAARPRRRAQLEEQARRNEVVAELEEACRTADDDTVERCLAAAQRVGGSKDAIKAAKAELRQRAKGRSEEARAAKDGEEARAISEALAALLDAPGADAFRAQDGDQEGRGGGDQKEARRGVRRSALAARASGRANWPRPPRRRPTAGRQPLLRRRPPRTSATRACCDGDGSQAAAVAGGGSAEECGGARGREANEAIQLVEAQIAAEQAAKRRSEEAEAKERAVAAEAEQKRELAPRRLPRESASGGRRLSVPVQRRLTSQPKRRARGEEALLAQQRAQGACQGACRGACRGACQGGCRGAASAAEA